MTDFEQLSTWAGEELSQIRNVLPDEVAELAEACLVSLENEPEGDSDLEEELLGLFEGASLIEDSSPDAMPRIRLFLGNLWNYARGDEQDFRDEVATTYLHELGHYLGWDEEEVAERGLE